MKASKVKFMGPLLHLLVFCFVFSGLNSQSVNSGPDTITLIHITDPHICNLTGYNQFFAQKRRQFGENARPFSQLLDAVPAKYHAEFIAITGDNIDFYEAQTAKEDMLDTQIEQYSALLSHSRVPVYLTLGNHDIASYFADSESTYSTNQFNSEKARSTWIRNIPCFKEGTYYSKVYKVDTTTYRLIFLDNGYYSTNEVTDKQLPFTIDQSQLLWLNSQLKSSTSDFEIIFMHMPLPYSQTEGDKIISEPLSTFSAKTIRNYNLLSVLENNSSTRLIVAGHKHINRINNYVFRNGIRMTQVMTAAFGYSPDNWRIIKLTKDQILIFSPGSSKPEYSVPLRQ
jgi:3',5'-cyclic AMP phosphodiesterase CpdA